MKTVPPAPVGLALAHLHVRTPLDADSIAGPFEDGHIRDADALARHQVNRTVGEVPPLTLVTLGSANREVGEFGVGRSIGCDGRKETDRFGVVGNGQTPVESGAQVDPLALDGLDDPVGPPPATKDLIRNADLLSYSIGHFPFQRQDSATLSHSLRQTRDFEG